MSGTALLIDLDDTIFPEESYVRSGFQAVATYLSREMLCGLPASRIMNRMWYEFRRLGRSGVFDRTLEAFGIAVDGKIIATLVDIYRDHEPSIEPYPGVAKALQQLRMRYPIAVVTDGNVRMQRRKVAALQHVLQGIPVIYCMDFNAPKPQLQAYEIASEHLGVSLQDCIFIGDDPYADIVAAHDAMAAAIRVRTGRAAEIPSWKLPDRYLEVQSLVRVPVSIDAFVD